MKNKKRFQYKPLKKQGATLKKDCSQFFIVQTGNSNAKQSQFEEVDVKIQEHQKQQQEEDDFVVLQQEQDNRGGIKAAQFWQNIKAINSAPPPSKKPVQYQISCPISFGFNSLGRDNIILIDNQICKAAGCLLIFNKKIYEEHTHKIVTLNYNRQRRQLISATDNSSPELFLWEYDSEDQTLSLTQKFFLGKKCEPIYAISLFQQNYIIAIEKFTLHKSSTLHFFNKNNQGKKQSTLKIGKFLDIQILQIDPEIQMQINEERIFYANDQGINQLKIQTKQNKQIIISELIQEVNNVACLCPFYRNNEQKQLQIIYGDKDGNVLTIYTKIKLKVHQGWIFQIKNKKYKEENYFFALGALDFHLSVLKFQNEKVKLLQTILLEGYGRSIYYEDDNLLIGKRYGDFQLFKISKLVEQNMTQKNIRNYTPSLKCFDSKQASKQYILQSQCQIKNNNSSRTIQSKLKEQKFLYSKNYVYASQNSRNLYFFSSEGKSLNNLEQYKLRYYPKAFDIHKNLISYIYDVQNKDQNSKTGSKFKNCKTFQKSVLVIEDFQSKSLIKKTALKAFQKKQNKNEQKFNYMKYSPSGKYIAVSNSDGSVFIIKFTEENIEEQACLIEGQPKKHTQQVNQIIWDRNEKYLKSISTSELHHWSIQDKQDNTKQDKQNIKLTYSKPGNLRDINWVGLGKFSWQTKPIWEKIGFVQDIYKCWQLEHISSQTIQNNTKTQIQTERTRIVGCTLKQGQLWLYNYPPNKQKVQKLKINDDKFEVSSFINEDEKFRFWILMEGILILIQLSE